MNNSRHNVAHILPWSSIGGTELATFRIAEAVEGRRFRSIAFCIEGESPVRSMFENAGFETATYQANYLSCVHPKPFIRSSLQLAREFKRKKVDIVHLADWQAAPFVAVAAKLARLPIISHVRNRYESEIGHDTHFLRIVNKFVFVSRDTWRHFVYRVGERRGTVIYDGIDIIVEQGDINPDTTATVHSVRQELGIPVGVKLIGMVARVALQKDYPTLIKAAARILETEPNVHFLVIGDHSQDQYKREHYEEVKHLLAASGTAPHFTFTGFRSDVNRLVRALDIFVLSTHYEGLPLVILEAMAQSKPVVATAVDGIPEIVIDGKTGLLHRHKDDEQLAAQLLSLVQDEARALRLGQAGCSFVKHNFSKERFATNMKSLYLEMLCGKNGLGRSSL